jgi:Spy/CpxP family protein refolding chaperone
MKKITLMGAAALILIGSSALGYAAEPGASGYSPGDKMHDSGKGSRGASKYAPGHAQKGTRGASENSPGDKMNYARHK